MGGGQSRIACLAVAEIPLTTRLVGDGMEAGRGGGLPFPPPSSLTGPHQAKLHAERLKMYSSGSKKTRKTHPIDRQGRAFQRLSGARVSATASRPSDHYLATTRCTHIPPPPPPTLHEESRRYTV